MKMPIHVAGLLKPGKIHLSNGLETGRKNIMIDAESAAHVPEILLRYRRIIVRVIGHEEWV